MVNSTPIQFNLYPTALTKITHLEQVSSWNFFGPIIIFSWIDIEMWVLFAFCIPNQLNLFIKRSTGCVRKSLIKLRLIFKSVPPLPIPCWIHGKLLRKAHELSATKIEHSNWWTGHSTHLWQKANQLISHPVCWSMLGDICKELALTVLHCVDQWYNSTK